LPHFTVGLLLVGHALNGLDVGTERPCKRADPEWTHSAKTGFSIVL
jgi:hypothetical protein